MVLSWILNNFPELISDELNPELNKLSFFLLEIRLLHKLGICLIVFIFIVNL